MSRKQYLSHMGLFRGLILMLKNLLGVNHCSELTYEKKEEEKPETFEELFENSELPDDLRPPIIIGATYKDEI